MVLMTNLLLGGAGPVWVCLSEETVGVFSHAHEHGCADEPAETPLADTCCVDLQVSGCPAFRMAVAAPVPVCCPLLAVLPPGMTGLGASQPFAPAPPVVGSGPPGDPPAAFPVPLSHIVLRL